MALGRKTGGRPFEPGNTYGVGRPALTGEEKKMRELTKRDFDVTANKQMYMTVDQLKDLISNPDTPSMEVMIASYILTSIKHGDEKKMEFFLNRLVGKVKDQIEITSLKPTITVIEKIDGSEIHLGADVVIENQGQITNDQS